MDTPKQELNVLYFNEITAFFREERRKGKTQNVEIFVLIQTQREKEGEMKRDMNYFRSTLPKYRVSLFLIGIPSLH